jgi:predicted O-linked N-acetylglucosamine transferase (SPINDLY family)
VSGFGWGGKASDALGTRVVGAFEHFIDVQDRSDQEVAQLARQLEIDIAVDLGGFTQGCRPRIFAMRAAPLQVSYLGYLGTMGAPYMDYLLADQTLVPVEHREHYSEKMLYLPSYQANDSKRQISERRFTRQELKLPESGFVFCCFNASCKITPEIFAAWMRILQRVAGSVLYLYAGEPLVQERLKREALQRGVAPERVVFGETLPVPEYLARYRAADLFLDTLPYNAGTTASDALWAGLPVLTCLGESFAGRVAGSLLNALELPELITQDLQQYEELAVELASEPGRLLEIRERLKAKRHSSLLFDTPRFTRNLEAAYREILTRHRAGAAPDHIFVQR